MPAGAFFRISTTYYFMKTFIAYLKATKEELKNVTFPSTVATITYTLVVIGVSVAIAAMLGLVDLGLEKGLSSLLAR